VASDLELPWGDEMRGEESGVLGSERASVARPWEGVAVAVH